MKDLLTIIKWMLDAEIIHSHSLSGIQYKEKQVSSHTWEVIMLVV